MPASYDQVERSGSAPHPCFDRPVIGSSRRRLSEATGFGCQCPPLAGKPSRLCDAIPIGPERTAAAQLAPVRDGPREADYIRQRHGIDQREIGPSWIREKPHRTCPALAPVLDRPHPLVLTPRLDER